MPNDQPKSGNEQLAKMNPSAAPPTDRVTAAAHIPVLAHAATPVAPNGGHPIVKWLLFGVLGLVALLVALYFGIPWAIDAWNTESTDDAYVNSYPTFVAPRVSGQIEKVLVKDNNRVHEGDKLVELDKVPYRIQVNLKKAAVAQAKADLLVAQDLVRGQVAIARGNRFKLEHTIEEVNNQIALLRANVAALENTKARLARAQADYDRAKELLKTPGAISQQDLDLKQQDFKVAESQVKQALETVYQTRVSLGQPAQPEKGMDLTQVPSNLNQTFSTVRQASADLLQSAAPLGIIPSSYDLLPQQILDEFRNRDPEGNVDRIYQKLLSEAPGPKQAEAKLLQAERDLEQAELNLKWCDVYAEIDGVILRRNVNKGNNVQAGQNLMAIRPLKAIWIDANFKETQLRELRIGQRARVEVDMYGSHRTFEGRITGFTMGTGQTLALLPPQNATGNFVKIVQRLPVRIELTDYDPETEPLFVGTSVTPYVYFREPPKGKDAGKFLQPYVPTDPAEKEAEK
jgi:membrane fusion protein (multidrug efflux system)